MRRELTFQATAPEAGASSKRPRKPLDLSTMLLGAVVLVLALGTVAAVFGTSSGPTQYACLTVTRSNGGSSVDVTSSGLIHYVGTQF